MTSNTEFYYTLSTIPQVLAAFLGLSSIFLIYCYSQIKNEILTVTNKVLELTGRYSGFKKFERIRYEFKSNSSIKSIKFLLKSFNELFTDPEFGEIIQDSINKQTDHEIKDKLEFQKDVLLNKSKYYVEALKRSSLRINFFAKWSFLIGIPSIIFSFSIIPLIPNLNFKILLSLTIILSIGSIISIIFMALLAFDYINRSKREFSL